MKNKINRLPGNSARLHIRLQGLFVLIVALLVLGAAPAMTAEQKNQKPQAAASSGPAATPAPSAPAASPPSGPAAIPVADVATQAAAVSDTLRTLIRKLATNAHIDMIRSSLPGVTDQVNRDQAETTRTLQRHPPLPTLQAMQQQWQQRVLSYGEWLTELTKRSNDLQDALNQLATLQKVWAMTLTAAEAAKAPGPSLQQINGTIAAIMAAQGPLREQLAAVLALQSSVGDVVAKCQAVSANVAQVQQASMSGILVQNRLPIVSPELWAGARSEIPADVLSAVASYRAGVNSYLQSSAGRVLLYIAGLAVLTLFFGAFRYQVRAWTAAGVTLSPALGVFDHWLAAALAVGAFVYTSPYWSTLPATVQETFEVLALAPMIILVRPVVSASLVSMLYAIGLLFTVDAIRGLFSGEQLTGQLLLILESLSGAGVVIFFLRNLRPAFGEAAGSSRLRLLQSGSAIVLLTLASGFIAAAMGYMRLARLATPGVLASSLLAVELYAALRVLIGIVAFSFQIWPFRTFQMVRQHQRLLEKRIYRILVVAAITGFLVRYLSYVGLLEPVLSFGKTVLDAKFQKGVISVSLGDILDFVVTVWAAFLLSSLIRFILREDVYPRVGVSPGKSYAISGLLHYFIIALGFTAAIAALGINLSKLTVLTGAFGVGIGFGLQSVVNNFVSGLILLFERPVHVGDMVEIGDLLGYVRRIGIRASTVHTRQGADIVVPNSQFITEKVTNWTLSDKLRRIDFPVGVNYSAAPKEVIKVLESVASAHPDVLRDPPPKALFTGYGDSSLNFELRAWTAEFENWQRVSSDLAVAMYDAVHAAGMSFPFPQREVRLLKDDDGGISALPGQQPETQKRI
jgi:potassium efflux system protein